MAKIAIIGYGNVGYHFSKILSYDHHVSIYSRNTKDGVNALSTFKPDGYDFIIIAISDDAIKAVAASFETTSSIVLHTSGSRPLSDLEQHPQRGVIYPLQTFSKSKEVDLDTLKIYFESTSAAKASVTELAKSISPSVRFMDSHDRAKMHLSAVFACNFSNHMFHIAENILKEIDLEFEDIRSLIEETVKKAMELSPSKSQTGPAIRQDVSTLASQENLIEDERIKEMYRLISQSIQMYH